MNQTISIEKKLRVKNFIRAPQKKDIIGLLLLMVVQRTNIFGMFPFGSVFFSAVCSMETAYLGIPVIFLTSLLSKAPYLKYTAVALIIWISDALIYINKEKRIPRMLICMLAVFICGIYDNAGRLVTANVIQKELERIKQESLDRMKN